MTNSYEDSNSGKKIGTIVAVGAAVVILGAAALYLVDVDQTKEAQLPTVAVDVDSGQMPEFDVDVAEVNIGSKKVGVDVPTMDVETKTVEIEVPVDASVGTQEKSFSVPTISIDKPEVDNPANN